MSPADVRTTRREDLHPFLVAMGRGLIDDVPVAVLTFAGSDLVNVNAEWTAMSGLSAIESVGDGWLTAIHPDDRAEAVLCTQPSVSAQDFEGDFRLLQVDGIDCWVRARSRRTKMVESALRVVTLTVLGRHNSNEARLLHMSTHDGLTGLPNRASLISKVRQVLAEQTGLAGMLFIDLDNFKEVNDHLGHRYGDQLLKAACKRIESSIRPTDFAGRLGGDEIGVFCPSVASRDEVYRLAERLGQAISSPFGLDREIVIIDASIGVAFATDSARIAESLLDEADRAMYVAKAAGGARWAEIDGGQRSRSHVEVDVDESDPIWIGLRALVARAEEQSTWAWRSSTRSQDFELSSRLGAIRQALRRASLLLRTDSEIDVVSVTPGGDEAPDRRAELLHPAMDHGTLHDRQPQLAAEVGGAADAGAVHPMLPPATERLAALRLVYAQHAAAVYGCARFICGPGDATNVTEKVFVALSHQTDWSDWSDWSDQPHGSMRVRLVTMAHRFAMDAALSAARAAAADQDTDGGMALLPEAVEKVLVRGQALERTLACARLSNDERSVAALVVYGRCSYKEVARILDESEEMVHRRLRAGLRRLRAALVSQS